MNLIMGKNLDTTWPHQPYLHRVSDRYGQLQALLYVWIIQAILPAKKTLQQKESGLELGLLLLALVT